MTIQEALNKAVEGGYHIYGSDGMDTYYEGATHDYSAWTRKDNESSFMIPLEETLLDPIFWQALGRTLRWSEACDLALRCVHGQEVCHQCQGSYWMYQWHCFIQALADGSTPEAFFAHLASAQTREREAKNQYRPFLFLLAEEARQHAQHICEEAHVYRKLPKTWCRCLGVHGEGGGGGDIGTAGGVYVSRGGWCDAHATA